ncbi:ATP-binding cassette subfamily G member 4-like isoform X2 [Aethina tumida]|uniref:ATP-binding cassette subfamily G member 4-like isoform X2 n=1 Tax=Aethina tumida TaxID=116153 RepID=UPI0021472E1F|nr:ATP-binding cassette subfamily G member 4-like isoform X2 [Aethina tumida]
MDEAVNSAKRTITCVSSPTRIDLEFHDLSFSVPQGRKGSKLILRNVNGQFKSRQLHAIIGPSGAGKTTLLNILAGYKCTEATGSIFVNGKLRNIKQFRKMSRYIMQEDLIQPMLSVTEAMMVAANLKLAKNIGQEEKLQNINEILDLLGLRKTSETSTSRLSGGERKRLAIALELLNNPPLIFLDEPTTGLDDLSCSQCIALLKMLAEGGRTVICSIHSPSARLFSLIDNVYVVASGQCVFQGYGPNVVPFLSKIGLDCPKHYNPADFIMEVCCHEYGDFHDKMVSAIDNGKCIYRRDEELTEAMEIPEDNQLVPCLIDTGYQNDEKINWFSQFRILLMRMWLQMWRDKNFIFMKIALHVVLGLLVGTMYIGMGQDGSKTIFNFGFYFCCLIFFMYIPMMPVLSNFPTEVHYLKREHFNKWYRLSAYFSALTVSTLPMQIILGTVYLSLVYLLSDQPLEYMRMIKFFSVCLLTGVISESFGLLISSQLNIVNAMFVGPVAVVPLMLLAVYGFGSGYSSIPKLIRVAMHFSYLRYSLEALIDSMLRDRPKLGCPDTEDHCIFTDLNYFIKEMGMENTIFWVDMATLVFTLVLFKGVGFYLLRQRLTPSKTFLSLQHVGRFVKSQLGGSR